MTKEAKEDVKNVADQQQPPKVVALPELILFEEDDEFEEFATEDWNNVPEAENDVQAWDDNWDDVHVDEDFSKQLRAELEKVSASR